MVFVWIEGHIGLVHWMMEARLLTRKWLMRGFIDASLSQYVTSTFRNHWLWEEAGLMSPICRRRLLLVFLLVKHFKLMCSMQKLRHSCLTPQALTHNMFIRTQNFLFDLNFLETAQISINILRTMVILFNCRHKFFTNNMFGITLWSLSFIRIKHQKLLIKLLLDQYCWLFL